MRIFSHEGRQYVQGEPIPAGHPALPRGTPYFSFNETLLVERAEYERLKKQFGGR